MHKSRLEEGLRSDSGSRVSTGHKSPTTSQRSKSRERRVTSAGGRKSRESTGSVRTPTGREEEEDAEADVTSGVVNDDRPNSAASSHSGIEIEEEEEVLQEGSRLKLFLTTRVHLFLAFFSSCCLPIFR